MVSSQIESSAFFLKSRKGRVTRAASGPYLSWSSPGLCLGPHSLCPNILGQKKKGVTLLETLRPLGFMPCFGRKLQTKKRMMYSPGGPYIVIAPVVTSLAVAGGVFTYVSSDTSHAEGVPHSDP